MKKIFIPESRLFINKILLVEDNEIMKLPSFIFKRVKNNNTSLANNLAFPPEEDYSFDYKILKKRFSEVTQKIKEIDDITSLDEEYLFNYLSSKFKECRELERPIRENLVKICENSVAKLLAIPEETVNLTCSIVDELKPSNEVRITPESSDNRNFDFEDLNEFENIGKVISKRRMINALIQGAAYDYTNNYETYLSDVYTLNKKLPELYSNIITVNDYLLFIKEEKISDKLPNQGGYVEVVLGRNGEKSEITAQGLIFPYLLNETIRGFFELFASHGLPNDNKKAMYIIKQADFLMAEPWDLRLGVGLWRYLSKQISTTQYLPYFFSTICELETDDFNNILREVFANTKYGQETIKNILDDIIKNVKFTDFNNVIKQKNIEYSLVTDGYFNNDELNDYMIEEDEEANDNYESLTIDDYKNIKAEDIVFIDEDVTHIPNVPMSSHSMKQIIPIINGIKIPVNLINFQVDIRNVLGEEMYQLHLFINDDLKHIGLGFKLCYAFILTYGMCYNGFGRMMNKNEMPKIWEKISKMPNIETKEIIGNNGKVIGIKSTLK